MFYSILKLLSILFVTSEVLSQAVSAMIFLSDLQFLETNFRENGYALQNEILKEIQN